jgi:uncharacterized protein (DUF58 family)
LKGLQHPLKKRLLFIILFLITIAIAFFTGSDLVLHLSIFVALIILLSYLWVFFNSRGLELKSNPLAERYQVGDYIDHQYILTNRSRLPKIFIRTQENSDMPGYVDNRVINIGTRGSSVWETSVICRKRGLYSLGSLRITITDPFGFFNKKLNLGTEKQITVCPQTLKLPYFNPLAYRSLNYGAHLPTSQVSPNVATVREYVDGDSLTHVHWRTTAHTGKLMIKLFDPEHSGRSIKTVWIILDMNKSSMVGNGERSIEEYTITIASSLIKKYIDHGCEVGVSASAEKTYHFGLSYGHTHLWNILIAMSAMKAKGEVPVEQLVSNISGQFNEDCLMVVITPSLRGQLARSLWETANQGCIIALILLDAHSFSVVEHGSIFQPFIHNNVQLYSIRCGDDLATSLNSQIPS